MEVTSNQASNLFGTSESAEKQKTDKEVSIKNKRDEYVTEIRKNKREEELRKRRNIRESNVENKVGKMQASGLMQMTEENVKLKEYIDQVLHEKFTMSDFFKILESINSNDRFQQHFGVIGLRKILSIDGPPIQPIIDSNLVPRLISFMQNEQEPHLQLESAWALTNVASGTTQQTQAIIDKGGIPLFVSLLSSPHTDVAEQAIWAIGNISGDSSTYRDMILNSGGLNPLIKLLQNSKNKNTTKHGTWALSNLCRGRPFPKFEQVKNAIPPLAQVIKTEVDPEILTDACWAMSYLSDGNERVIESVVSTEVVSALIKHLKHPFISISIPCLRTLGNIVTGNEAQTDIVMSYPNIAGIFLELLSHNKKPIRRETCWVLSNVTAGTADQIQVLLNCKGFVEKLTSLALTDSPEVKRESTWVLSNAVSHGRFEQIRQMVDLGLIDTMVEHLKPEEDTKLLTVSLECIYKVLQQGVKLIEQFGSNLFLDHLESLHGTPKIEALQTHKSEDVYNAAIVILETFYDINDPI